MYHKEIYLHKLHTRKLLQFLQPISYPNSSNIDMSLLGWWHSSVRPGHRLCPLGSPREAWPARERQESPTSTAQQVPGGLGKGLCCQSLFWNSVNQFYTEHVYLPFFPNSMSYPCKTKDKLQRFLQSMTSKSGKLRAPVRDLKKGYSAASISQFPGYNKYWILQSYKCNFLEKFFNSYCEYVPWFVVPDPHHCQLGPRCVKSLEDQISAVDTQYDLCHEAWGKGEVDRFASEEFPGPQKVYSSFATHTHIHTTFMCINCFVLSM